MVDLVVFNLTISSHNFSAIGHYCHQVYPVVNFHLLDIAILIAINNSLECNAPLPQIFYFLIYFL